MELRECPFCGSQHIGFDFVETYSTDSSYGIFGCRECGFHINTSDDRCESAEEISAWNRRSSHASVPEGYVLVPVEPTEEQWGELARDIMMWLDFDRQTPRTLFDHLRNLGVEAPQWLIDEPEMKNLDHVPSKGTRCALIYKAMLAAAPTTPVSEGCWLPIETAPKDKFVLLAGPSGYTTIEIVYATGRMCSDYHVGRWIDHANDDLTDWGFEPTHWMPLPEAPAMQEDKP